MKKIIAAALALLILLSACGKETVGTDYDFSPVIEKTVEQTIEAAPSPVHDSIYGEWSVINAARSGVLVPQSWFDEYYANLSAALKEADGVLSTTKNTEYSRTIIAVSAIGKDPANVAGYNLFSHYMTMDEVTKQGLPGAIFALIALDCKDYSLPEGSEVTREALVDYILENEYEGGGWAIIGDSADVDVTAQALQALAPHTNDERVASAAERAVNLLSERQNDDGGFYAWQGINSQTTAQVIIALTSLGIDPRTDERFIKSGGWTGSFLMKYYLGDGTFCHTLGNGADAMATDQCLQALISLELSDNGGGAFYNFA